VPTYFYSLSCRLIFTVCRADLFLQFVVPTYFYSLPCRLIFTVCRADLFLQHPPPPCVGACLATAINSAHLHHFKRSPLCTISKSCVQGYYITKHAMCVRTLRCVHENIVAAEKQSILHICVCGACVCVCACVNVALLIQHGTRHVVTSFVAPLAPPYFSTLSHKQHDFRKKKKLLNIKCVFLFSLKRLSKIFLIL
jgi:hypothetical protein